MPPRKLVGMFALGGGLPITGYGFVGAPQFTNEFLDLLFHCMEAVAEPIPVHPQNGMFYAKRGIVVIHRMHSHIHKAF